MIFDELEKRKGVFTGNDCDDEDEVTNTSGELGYMKKMSKGMMKKFPILVDDSILCQSLYVSKCERCNGCELAVDGCEKVFSLSCC